MSQGARAGGGPPSEAALPSRPPSPAPAPSGRVPAVHSHRPVFGFEIQLVAAAREIGDRELVFAGAGLPLAAFQLAKRTHAPQAVALDENGVVRDHRAWMPLASLAEPPSLRGASMACDLQAVMSLLQQGRVDLGFLEAAEVDRFGNIGAAGADLHLPRSGSATDVACLARRTVILLRHERQRFRERVAKIIGPGYGEGGGWRQKAGLPGRGPVAIITDLAVLRFDEDGEGYLASIHPGVSIEEVQMQTGWSLRIPARPEETASPTVLERNLVAEIGPGDRRSGEATATPDRLADPFADRLASDDR